MTSDRQVNLVFVILNFPINGFIRTPHSSIKYPNFTDNKPKNNPDLFHHPYNSAANKVKSDKT